MYSLTKSRKSSNSVPTFNIILLWLNTKLYFFYMQVGTTTIWTTMTLWTVTRGSVITVSTCNKYSYRLLNKICRFFTFLVLNDVRISSEGSDSEDDTYARPDMNLEPVYSSIRDHIAHPDSSSGRWPLCAGAPCILLGSLYHITKSMCL